MAGEKRLQQYENLPDQILTLTEVSETVTDYPAVVRVVPKEYEIPDSKDLPGEKEVLLEKPKCLKFVPVRILDFDDVQQEVTEKGKEFIDERDQYIGKEILIPIGFQGTFKLVNKKGHFARYVSVEQIIRDLPRFIRINQETEYCPPGQSRATSLLAAGTILEVKRASTVDKVRYIKCESTKPFKAYMFREDFPINCTAVEDTAEHTFLNMAAQHVLLPKNVQFKTVWADDVVFKDDDEAHEMLILTGGPIKILKAGVTRKMFIAWLKPEGSRQTVGLVPDKIWNNQFVQLKVFRNASEKKEYISQHFGVSLDSNFVVSGLYMMKQIETDVIWLLAPKTNKTAQILVDYENIEKILADYEDVKSGNEEDEAEDYEKPVPKVQDGPPVPPKPELPHQFVPPVPPPPPRREHLLLPTPKVRKDDILQKIKEKARLGFDKVHEQLLKHVRQKSVEAHAKDKTQTHSMTYSRSKSESEWMRENTRKRTEKKCLSKSLSDQDGRDMEFSRTQRLSKASDFNKNRPLPALPTKGEINITDDDKLDMYDEPVDKEGAFLRSLDNVRLQKSSDPKLDTLAHYPDLKKIGRECQTSEDFFSYSVDELVECLKMCSLDKLAVECSRNKLDGAFFRNFDLNELNSEPFFLSKLDVFKVQKIIKEGWRPKTDYVVK